MPRFLTALGVLGTAAMIWVGGGIIVHGLEAYGFRAIAQFIHQAAAQAAALAPAASGLLHWLVSALGSGLVGLVIGATLLPLTTYVAAPAIRFVGQIRERSE
jgi:predicted DNA repair protein MutK